MTKRRNWCVLPAAAVLFLLCAPRDAFAIIGWVERLSGPGRFWGSEVTIDRLVCIAPTDTLQAATVEPKVFCRDDGRLDPSRSKVDPKAIRAFLSLELTRAHAASSLDELRYPAIDLTASRGIIYLRLTSYLDAGAGLGYTEFTGNDIDLHKWSVPLRVRATWPGLDGGSRWRGIYLQGNADIFLSSLSSDEFKAGSGATPFRNEHELVKSLFLAADLVKLISGL